MFRKKKQTSTIVPCEANQNNQECLIITEIHELQHRRTELAENMAEYYHQIDETDTSELQNYFINSNNAFHAYGVNKCKPNSQIIQQVFPQFTSKDLYSFASILNQLILLEVESRKINTRLTELKEKLGIK